MADAIDLKKLVSKDALGQYHVKLTTGLGVKGDGSYTYGGERTDYPTGKKNVGTALDYLYDQVKQGGVVFAEGKATDASSTIKFNSNDGEDTNQYFINAQIGDEKINIQLDGNDFVKDSFLSAVNVVIVAIESGETVYYVDEYKVDEKPEGFDDEAGEGAYLFFTWIVSNGESGDTKSYSTISFDDVFDAKIGVAAENLDGTDDVAINVEESTEGGKKVFTIQYQLATEDDIDEFFVVEQDPEPSEISLYSMDDVNFLSDESGNASIDNAGSYPLTDNEGTDMEYTISKQ